MNFLDFPLLLSVMDKVNQLKGQIELLRNAEIRIRAELELLSLQPVSYEMSDFFQWAYNDNQISIGCLGEIADLHQTGGNASTDEILSFFLQEMNSSILTHKGDNKSIEHVIAIYFHSILGYLVKNLVLAIEYASVVPDLISVQFLTACLSHKQEIKNRIQKLEEKIVTGSSKSRRHESDTIYA